MSKKTVLYLSYDGLTDPLGQSQIIPYLCELSGLGYAISIVSFEKPDRFSQEKERVNKICQRHNLNWISKRYHKWPPVVSTLYDLLVLRSTIIKLNEESRFSIVHCRSYLTSLLGLWMKKKFGIKFIFDMRGFWPDERVEGGLWDERKFLYRLIYNFFKKKEDLFFRGADVIVTLTEKGREFIQSKYEKASVEVIPCCVDADIFNPKHITDLEKLALRESMGINKDEFVLLYLGSWGTWYLTDSMLLFFKALKDAEPKTKFLIVTLDEINLDSFKYKDSVVVKSASRADVPKFISVANCAVLFIKPTFSKMASSATKMGEFLAMNTPVVTNTGWGDVDKYISELPNVIPVDFKQPNYDLTIEKMSKTEMIRSRDWVLSNLSLPFGIRLYAKVYQFLSQNED